MDQLQSNVIQHITKTF
uniref:Uncharacterized protein n=1 Tax=Rhizophora mucronata TaxID=61149 RepID=A0A2P2IK67_RHIMU